MPGSVRVWDRMTDSQGVLNIGHLSFKQVMCANGSLKQHRHEQDYVSEASQSSERKT